MPTESRKIAVVTDDGVTISQHFGKAVYYQVLTVENGALIQREMRHKLSHAQMQNEPHEADQAGEPHGMGAGSQNRHIRMSDVIADCEAVLCRGMGAGAYYSMEQRGIRPVVTDIRSIDEAVHAYLDGMIVDHTERLH